VRSKVEQQQHRAVHDHIARNVVSCFYPKRRSFTDQFEAEVVLKALHGNKTEQEITAKHQLLTNHQYAKAVGH